MSSLSELHLAQAEDTRHPQQKFTLEKLLTDLSQGFSITDSTGSITRIAVATHESSFFCVMEYQPKNKTYPYRRLEIRRKKLVGNGKGTATKERFVLDQINHLEAVPMFYINQKKNGRLSESEFFEAYNAAQFNFEATSQLQTLLSHPSERV